MTRLNNKPNSQETQSDLLTLPWLADVPHFDQYVGVWAIREQEFLSHVEWAKSLDLNLHLRSAQAVAARAAESKSEERGSIAIIPLQGTLMKHASSMGNNTSTILARRQIRAAAADSGIKAILLHIDSPGGTVAGTKELADDVYAAAADKPVYAYIEDLGASAAYWIASQATKVFANETAIVGSIGTYGVIHDASGMAAKEGIKVHVVRAGAMKGVGTPGTEVTAEHLAELQRIVNDQNEFFIKGVSRVRPLTLSQVRNIADGRVHVGKAAAELGLIDGVATLDAVFGQLSKTVNRGTKTMSEQPTAATIQELKAACPNADAVFLMAQMEASATIEAAGKAWMTELTARLAAKDAELVKAKAAPPPAPAPAAGVDPLPAGGGKPAGGDGAGGDAMAEFQEKVADLVKLGKPEHVATAAICRKYPELRAAYVAAHNAAHPQSRR